MFDNVIFEKKDGVGIIKINRPKAMNAFNIELGDDLVKSLEMCFDDREIRSIIITGEGKAFCAGGDLNASRKYLESEPSEIYRQMTKRLNRIITDIRLVPKPVVAAVNGIAGSVGMSIAVACDLRIAGNSAKFKQSYTGVGLVPDGGWTLLLPLLIGLGRANELLFTDPIVDANRALEIGLVNRVVDDAELADRAFELAGELAQGPSEAYSIIKELINNAVLGMLEKQIEVERTGIIKAAKTEDYHEGINAFFEKRRPKFTGR